MDTILIVEDDNKIRGMYTRLLTSEGYNVIGASNAYDANEMLKKIGIDLILLDIKMPEVAGGDLYEVIQLFYRKTRVIVSSVYPMDEQKRIIPGAFDYHDKSHGIDILMDKVRKALKEPLRPETALR